MVVDLLTSEALSEPEADRVFRALADATRRDILARAIEREQSVSALARIKRATKIAEILAEERART
jgi:DNA-binding transcriptional ArsR family regulator